MPLETLVLCSEETSLRVLRRVFGDVGIELRIVSSSGEALDAIAHHKFDAVVVDCDDIPDACDVLKALREGRSNRNSIAFAVLNGKTSIKQANVLGSNFILEKPLLMDRVGRSVRAAHGLIMRERRRYFRHELHIPMNVTSGMREMGATLINLGEGGCAILPGGTAALTGIVIFKFQLPNTTTAISGSGGVAWTKPDGSVGIRFNAIDACVRTVFDNWLTEKVERELKKPTRMGFADQGVRTETA